MIRTQIYDTSNFEYYHWDIAGIPAWLWLARIFQISVLAAALGFYANFSLALALFSFVAFHYPIDSQFLPFDNNLVPLVLLILTFTPFGDLPTERWTKKAVVLLLGLTYFGAAVSKLHNTGWDWADGSVLSAYLFERYIVTGNASTLELARSAGLCKLIAIFSLLFEFTFWLCAFVPRLTWIFVPVGIAGHVFGYFVLRINFLEFYLITYWIFLVSNQKMQDRPASKTT